jgi:hypothetical protein
VAPGVNQREVGDGPEPLTFGQITTGHIDVGDFDIYTFTGKANDLVTLGLIKTDTGAGNPTIRLFDPEGAYILGTCGDGVRVFLDALPLAKTGTYLIEVSDCDSQNGSYGYSLCGVRIPGPNLPDQGEGTELVSNRETRIASITPGDLDAYTFSVIAGDDAIVTLTKTSGEGLPVLSVYDNEGRLLANDPRATSARVTIPCSSQPGPFTIVCRESALTRAFTYTLSLVQTPGPPPSYDPARPYLTEFRCLTNVVTRWPTNASGFQLEFCDDLCATTVGGLCSGVWTMIPPPYPVIGDHYFVTNRSSASMRFFRLSHP